VRRSPKSQALLQGACLHLNPFAFLRLYMVPGMAHCAGGPGAIHFSTATRDSEPPVSDARHEIARHRALGLYDLLRRCLLFPVDISLLVFGDRAALNHGLTSSQAKVNNVWKHDFLMGNLSHSKQTSGSWAPFVAEDSFREAHCAKLEALVRGGWLLN
jgi:hypothetical protein